ncbi:MAG: hypothetical protein JMN27_12810 [gamma proteobacterium endosymbiont of Lamellibrachia anaximandri]|nr:hypothetical protein [gamma proteobacterium endosymbiont of Lamellibrachia anaximandri]MBL3534702.1 hypothetical protein [gamma proteobacterium endosymbiont of Lamellibrachia anaximandri]MBL3600613.1 hypothetical protein [gamma proteobacterium endosymbiont of Lamellibrachia anaximandri]
MLNRRQICERLPHSGSMCLLDSVEHWDNDNIQCIAINHREPSNPLRNPMGLPTISGVEYAAQAMAVHGSLLADDNSPRMGFLAGLRDLELKTEWLHNLQGELVISAHKLAADEGGAIYDFHMEANSQPLLKGRATVIYQNRGIES